MRTLASLVYILVALVLTAGCSFTRKYPEIREYLVEPIREGEPLQTQNNFVVLVRPFEISPAYDKTPFIIRDGNAVREDYYHHFAIDPDDIVRESAITWLEDARLFENIASSESMLKPTHSLGGRVAAVYWENNNAVLRVHFRLLDLRESTPRVVLAELYTASTPTAGSDPDSRVAAMQASLSTILRDLEADLGRVTE